eukprot:scaffold210028_cov23-Cyclotella_meneghiniana.AAC.1
MDGVMWGDYLRAAAMVHCRRTKMEDMNDGRSHHGRDSWGEELRTHEEVDVDVRLMFWRKKISDWKY